jgi:acetyl-CoA hydrolase
MAVLSGVRIVELAGLGPGPFCGMLLADLGAEVTLVERVGGGDSIDFGATAIFNRGKRSIALDLKAPEAVELVLRLVERADGLVEGMRPGVMERLGLGPEVCLRRNPRLAYGRMTGWGQSGPLAARAGHDLNYLGLSGAAWFASPPGQPPFPPPTLVGDLGGGALYLAVGVLAAILHARSGGPGQVVDAAIVDGSAHLLNLLLSLKGSGQLGPSRGESILDGPHWSRCYRCADGRYVSVQAVEPRFYATLLERLGLASDRDLAEHQYDPARWPDLSRRLEALFATRTRDAWCALVAGSDACLGPVLDPDEAARHPHNVARGTFTAPDGVLQAAPAPRFPGAPAPAPGVIPRRGEHTEAVLRELGVAPDEVARLRAAGLVATAAPAP